MMPTLVPQSPGNGRQLPYPVKIAPADNSVSNDVDITLPNLTNPTDLATRLEKVEIRLQLNEELLRLKKKQITTNQTSEDARFQLMWQRINKLENTTNTLQDAILSLERTMSAQSRSTDDKLAEMEKRIISTIQETIRENNLQTTAIFETKMDTIRSQLEESNQERLKFALSTTSQLADVGVALQTVDKKMKAQNNARFAVQSQLGEVSQQVEQLKEANIDLKQEYQLMLRRQQDALILFQKNDELRTKRDEVIQSDLEHLHEVQKETELSNDLYTRQIEELKTSIQDAVQELTQAREETSAQSAADIAQVNTDLAGISSQVEELKRQDDVRESVNQMHVRAVQSVQAIEHDRRIAARNEKAINMLSQEMRDLKRRFINTARYFNNASHALANNNNNNNNSNININDTSRAYIAQNSSTLNGSVRQNGANLSYESIANEATSYSRLNQTYSAHGYNNDVNNRSANNNSNNNNNLSFSAVAPPLSSRSFTGPSSSTTTVANNNSHNYSSFLNTISDIQSRPRPQYNDNHNNVNINNNNNNLDSSMPNVSTRNTTNIPPTRNTDMIEEDLFLSSILGGATGNEV